MPALFDKDPDTATVADVKRWLRVHAPKGAVCPCCKQHVKIYRRALGSQMARWLIWLVRTWEQKQAGVRSPVSGQLMHLECNHPWIDVKLSPVRGGDYAKLIHWELVEHKVNEPKQKRPDGSRPKDSGLWRPTFKGIDFVHQRLSVPSHMTLYCNLLLEQSDDLIKIHQALGKKFDYHKLMNAPINVEVPV